MRDPAATMGGTLVERVTAFPERLRQMDSRLASLNRPDRPAPDAPDVPEQVADPLELVRWQREALLVANEELQEQAGELARLASLLKDERVRSRTMFDLSPEARFITDVFAVVHDANLAAGDLLGIDVGHLRGKPLAAYVGRADVGRFRAELTRLAEGGRIEVALTLVGRDGGGAPVTLVGSRVDDTNEIFWSARLVGASAQGNQPVARVSLTPGQHAELLAEVQRECAELTSAWRERDATLAVLAHELRAPTCAILGWTRLLQHPRIDSGPRDRALSVIEHNALMQLALVDDLMESSRFSSHKVELERAALNLVEVVDAAIDGARPVAAEKGVTLRAETIGECMVEGDGRRLMQVVSNLLTNAVKFTPPGGAVTAGVTAADGVATMRVTDTGVGIAPEQLPHIFDRFNQGTHAHDAAGGLGLGLFVVHEIVSLHGGTVTAVSPGEGLGATITVTLPLATP